MIEKGGSLLAVTGKLDKKAVHVHFSFGQLGMCILILVVFHISEA